MYHKIKKRVGDVGRLCLCGYKVRLRSGSALSVLLKQR